MTKKNVKYFIYGILIITLMLSGCTGRSSGDWVVFRGQSGQGNTSERIFPPIGIKWQFKLQEGGVRERRFNPPVVFQDTLFFGSSDSNFYALDLNTGFMRWVFKTRAPVNSVPYVDSRKVFFGSTDGYIYAVYHRTGTLAWEHFTGAPVNSTIVGHNDTIVFTTDLGATHFFTRYGREIKAIPNYVWLSNSFQINNDVVYFMPGPPENPFSLAAFHIPTQRYIWTLPTVGRQIWYSFPAISGNILHYASVGVMGNYFTYIFSALDRRTGEPIWQVFERSSLFDIGGYDPIDLFWENIALLDYMAPAIWRNYVIYAPGDRSIRAFAASTGRKVWERWFDFPVSSAPTVAGSRVYFGVRRSPDGDVPSMLVCLDAASGRILWTIETEGDILGSPIIAGGRIIFGTDKNYVYVLEELF